MGDMASLLQHKIWSQLKEIDLVLLENVASRLVIEVSIYHP